MASTAEARKRVRIDSRRRLILEAAAAEFAAVGYERATLVGIGERVGLSKASLYHYVESKESLFVELVERVVEDIEARAAAKAGKSKDAVVRLRAFVHAHLEVALTTQEGKLLASNLDAFVSSDAAAVPKKRHETALKSVLRDGVAQGLLKDVPLTPVVKLTLGMLNAMPLWFDPKGALSIEAMTDLVLDVLLGGMTSNEGGRRGRSLRPPPRERPKRAPAVSGAEPLAKRAQSRSS